jgi:hypothetical protein
MNKPTTLGARIAAAESAKSAMDLGRLALAILRGDGKVGNAVKGTKSIPGGRLHPDLQAIIDLGVDKISRVELQKAAQSSQSLGTDTALANYTAIASNFIGSLSAFGCFDAMLPSMTSIPLSLSVVGAVTTGASSFQIVEGQMKALSKLVFSNQNAEPFKCISALTLSRELARFAPAGTLELVQNELRKAVSKTTDTIFINTITSGVSPGTSTGSTATSLRADLHYLLTQVGMDQNSKPFLITNSTVIQNLVMQNDRGTSCYPALTPTGGSINGIPVLISDSVGTGLIILADASGLAANGGDIILTEADQASLQFNDAPDSPPGAGTAFINLWQMNLVGLRVERTFMIEKIRGNAVAAVSNSGSWASGDSPP